MAKQSINQLKQWFLTGKKPTQQQFHDWLESFFHKDDTIDIDNVTDLQIILNAKADLALVNSLKAILFPIRVQLNVDGEFEIPAGFMMEKMIVTPTVDSPELCAGTIPGGSDIMAPPDPEEPIGADVDYVVNCDVVARNARTVYVSHVAGATTILIYLKTLTPQN